MLENNKLLRHCITSSYFNLKSKRPYLLFPRNFEIPDYENYIDDLFLNVFFEIFFSSRKILVDNNF